MREWRILKAIIKCDKCNKEIEQYGKHYIVKRFGQNIDRGQTEWYYHQDCYEKMMKEKEG